MNRILLVAAIMIAVAAVAIFGVAKRGSFSVSTSARLSRSNDQGVSETSESDERLLVPVADSRAAPSFSEGDWINSEPSNLEGLRGRVVLVDFWTFGCYNCRNTLPALKGLDSAYRERGLTIIGVHTPELDRERKLESVKREVASLGIRYPVVTDNDYKSWNAYGVSAWPTVFILDKQGRIRYTHIGEGGYAEQEDVIKRLLDEGKKE
jgi:thiol-disulfide isomerase/thioredoxin